jgi:hypothetical protein
MLILSTLCSGGIYRDPEPTLSIYERQIAPLVTKAMAGFNSTIFAYGQTGSGESLAVRCGEENAGQLTEHDSPGKTHTMVCTISGERSL